MHPRMPRTVTVRTPGAGGADPVTGNPVDGPLVDTVTRAYLAQLPVAQLSAQVELAAAQTTTIAAFTLLVPPDVPLTARSEVVDEDGQRYEVIGDPADRRGLGTSVLYRAAALHRSSDLQPT